MFKFCPISNYSNSVLLLCILLNFRFIQFVLLCNQKSKGTFNGLQKKIKKNKHTIKFLSSRVHPRVLLCCAAPTFMLFHYSLFLKFVNNFEISCQDNEFALKVEFTL